VWHCHILSHEEMDMMRPISVNVARALPDKPIVTYTRNGAVKLAWTDGTPVTDALGDTWGRPDAEVGYRIERATVAANGNPGTYTRIATAPANQTAYTDASAGSTTRYSYRVTAFNAAGDAPSTAVLAGPAGVAAPAAPTQLAATLQAGPQIGLSWRDNAGTETGFVVERAVNGSGNYVPLATPAERTGTGTVTYIDTTVKAGTSYQYRVKAVNGGGSSAYVSGASVTVPALPGAPSNLTATAARANGNNDTVTLKWTDNATNEAAFEVQRSASATFSGPTTQTAPANATQLVQTGLVRNRTYHYRVRATNPGGPSDWSNAVSVTTP
jgi:FtsP/CotA-like multicopper oxidase with cupredoxin domain